MSSNIVHQYQDFQITQQQTGFGLVSLTDMAKANGKLVGNYLNLKSSIAYREALSGDIEIPISQLLVVVKGNSAGITQGTWAHPEIALDFAQWVSIPFRIWANRTLLKEIEKKATQPDACGSAANTFSAKLEKSKLIAAAMQSVLSSAHLGSTQEESDNLLAGAGLSVLGLRHPELKEELLIGHRLLAATTATPKVLLTPTVIGKQLDGISARAVNELLIVLGYQTRVPKDQRSKGLPDYRPTEKGKDFSSNTLATGHSGDNATYQHFKWTEDIVSVLADFLKAPVTN